MNENEIVSEEKDEKEEVQKWLGLYFPTVEQVMQKKYSNEKMVKFFKKLDEGQFTGKELLDIMADLSSIYYLQELREIKKLIKDEFKERRAARGIKKIDPVQVVKREK